MNFDEFLIMTDGEVMTHEQAQTLNEYLAKKSVDSIQEENRHLVVNYLLVALNMNSVDPALVPSLDILLESLQQIT